MVLRKLLIVLSSLFISSNSFALSPVLISSKDDSGVYTMLDILDRGIKINWDWVLLESNRVGMSKAMKIFDDHTEILTGYYYETRCTCGQLFAIHETREPAMHKKISHTTCYYCFVRVNAGSGYEPSKKLMDSMRKSTLQAETKFGKRNNGMYQSALVTRHINIQN